jgi:hypothetical protein
MTFDDRPLTRRRKMLPGRRKNPLTEQTVVRVLMTFGDF